MRPAPIWIRWLRLAGLLAVAWCVMTFTHEGGHLVGGWLGGATLSAAELRPWRLPYSIFAPDPRPLLTLWSGPLLGAIVPLAGAAAVRRGWGWFIAHFCLLANGSYLAAAWISGDRLLDTPQLLAAGASPVSILLYIAATVAIGYRGLRRECLAILRPSADDR
jgi:hypothetical protein